MAGDPGCVPGGGMGQSVALGAMVATPCRPPLTNTVPVPVIAIPHMGAMPPWEAKGIISHYLDLISGMCDDGDGSDDTGGAG